MPTFTTKQSSVIIYCIYQTPLLVLKNLLQPILHILPKSFLMQNSVNYFGLMRIYLAKTITNYLLNILMRASPEMLMRLILYVNTQKLTQMVSKLLWEPSTNWILKITIPIVTILQIILKLRSAFMIQKRSSI